MAPQKVDSKQVHLEAKNIGGIEQTYVTFSPGVTILEGRNATNRTSLMQAIMAGVGSTDVSLKGDADSGTVSFQIGNTTYTRSLERQGGTVQFGGDPYLDDPEQADLFAFLLESNEARRAVALEQNLREIIMQPVDADAIKTEIRQLQAERDDIDDRIEQRKHLKNKLPKLTEQKSNLTQQIDEKEEQLEAKRDELGDLSADAEEVRAEQSELDKKMQTLQQKRSSLDTTEFRLDSERESLESLESECEQLEAEYDDLMDRETGDIEHIEREIGQLREKKQHLERKLNKLQSVIQFNEEMLDGTNMDIAAALRGDDNHENVTDQLLDDGSEVVCWTCGTEVDVEKIENTLDRLRNLRQSKHAEQSDIEEELSELKREKSEIESTKREREEVQGQLTDIKSEIEQRESKIEEIKSEKQDLTEEIEQVKADIEYLKKQDHSEVLDVHREVNELEIEIDRLKSERESVAEEIEEIESEEKEIENLQQRREQVNEQLDELRTRIERIEKDAIGEFNDHMDAVLKLLDYDNLDRIWVERVETETRQGRQKVETTEFRLHIVRSTDKGVTYEDELEHLSESELEVTGLIFALAGYLAHDIYQNVPFMLLDSLEAIDSERIAALINYLREYAEYLVVALLPEDANALDEEHERVAEI